MGHLPSQQPGPVVDGEAEAAVIDAARLTEPSSGREMLFRHSSDVEASLALPNLFTVKPCTVDLDAFAR
jgi:hypothetical protein